MSGVEWQRFDAAHVLSVMALPTLSFYEAWVKLMPDRAGRLEEIAAGVASEFRTALLSNPANSMDPDPAMIPLPCVRYAETLAIAAICREMDKPLSDSDQRQLIRAEINLRYFYTGRLQVSGPEPGSGKPSYARRRKRGKAETQG
jgi:hypothetical protein